MSDKIEKDVDAIKDVPVRKAEVTEAQKPAPVRKLPAPIVAMVEHQNRLYVATTEQVYRKQGEEFIPLNFKG